MLDENESRTAKFRVLKLHVVLYVWEKYAACVEIMILFIENYSVALCARYRSVRKISMP